MAQDFNAAQIADARGSITRISADFDQIVDIATSNGLVLDRLHGTGRLDPKTAREMQVVGVPRARAD
jgi:Ni,Fe-hydrogenase III large subunit